MLAANVANRLIAAACNPALPPALLCWSFCRYKHKQSILVTGRSLPLFLSLIGLTWGSLCILQVKGQSDWTVREEKEEDRSDSQSEQQWSWGLSWRWRWRKHHAVISMWRVPPLRSRMEIRMFQSSSQSSVGGFTFPSGSAATAVSCFFLLELKMCPQYLKWCLGESFYRIFISDEVFF